MMIETVTPEKLLLPKLYTTVYLEDFGEGKGKIIVDSENYGATSHYWGAMGCSLKTFLIEINSDYFAGKLAREEYEFSGKLTAKEMRRYIKEDLSYEMPWYLYQEGQKEFRKFIKEVEYINSGDEFVYRMGALDSFDLSLDIESMYDQKEFEEIIEGHFKQEPWRFIMKDITKEYKFLQKVHTELKKILK